MPGVEMQDLPTYLPSTPPSSAQHVEGEQADAMIILRAQERGAEDRAVQIAASIAADPHHIIAGAGSVWPEACYYGMCILEEMQWIRTRPVHAADFFHGTLELVEDDVSVILLKGEDPTRPARPLQPITSTPCRSSAGSASWDGPCRKSRRPTRWPRRWRPHQRARFAVGLGLAPSSRPGRSSERSPPC